MALKLYKLGNSSVSIQETWTGGLPVEHWAVLMNLYFVRIGGWVTSTVGIQAEAVRMIMIIVGMSYANQRLDLRLFNNPPNQ